MNVERIIAQLTVEEKIRLLAGASMWSTEPIERLGVPSVIVTDGPHGVRLTDMESQQTQPATAFPNEAAMAATWNESLIRQAGLVMAEECQHFGVGILLGPGVNGKRSPLGGRNFEYFSEDPYLTGRMGAAFVQGVQSGGVGTSVKHFVANEQEKNRMVASSEVDERALREIYMLPFEMIVKEAAPWTVMCSYNKVNGVQMGHHQAYLEGVLKREWGFDGLVMSDWGAVVDKVASVQGGLDLEMPGPGRRNEEVMEAYRKGLVTDEQLDDRVRRILSVVKKAVEAKREVPSIDAARHHAVARQVAEESLVLLKNDDRLLPLAKGARVAVVGAFAKTPRIQGGGSSHMNPARLDVPFDAIAAFADAQYAPGYDGEAVSEELLEEAAALARGRDAAIVFVGTTDRIESEGYDRTNLSLPESHLRLIEAVAAANSHVIVVNHSGSAVDLEPVEPRAQSILHAWLPGQAGGAAVANVIFGETNPSGKLSETFPVAVEHNPSYGSFPGDVRRVTYTEGIFVGYRHYDTRKLPVRYAFGHGLSYTEFEYGNVALSRSRITNGEELLVRVDIKNIGARAGKEIVQVYVQDVKSSVPKALRELKGFAKAELAPGETKTVEIKLDERAFAHYVERLGAFAVESGDFAIAVGASSRDIRWTGTVTFASKEEAREPLTPSHDLKDWLEDERSAARLRPIYERMEAESNSPFFPIVLGMPIRKSIEFLPILGISGDVMNELKEVVALYSSEASET